MRPQHPHHFSQQLGYDRAPPPFSLRPIEVPHDRVKDSQAGCETVFIWYQSTWVDLSACQTKQLNEILHLNFLEFSKFTSHFLFPLF